MTQLIADQTPLAVLAHLLEPVEICDPSGKVVGYYTPADSARVKALPPLSPADLAELQCRMMPGRRSYTTKELFEQLQSITEDPPMRDYLQKKIAKLEERDRCDLP